MTNQERNTIVKNAVDKTIANGWYIGGDKVTKVESNWGNILSVLLVVHIVDDRGNVRITHIPSMCLIFMHHFAKALWGEALVDTDLLHREMEGCRFVTFMQPAWKYHLQREVLAEDPFKYLGDNT